MVRSRIAALFVAILVAMPSAAEPPASKWNHDVDAFIHETLTRLPYLPGVAVVVVDDDQPVYVKGFGYRDVEHKLPVTPETEFYIASSTKSFTALAAALMANDGKFNLDAPLSRYFPKLEMKPPLSADKITIRSLLTHQSGMKNIPIVIRTAYTGNATRDDLVRLLGVASESNGEKGFKYDNIGYVVTAMAMEQVTGTPWQTIVEDRVFEPLRMRHTTCRVSDAKSWPVATPYSTDVHGTRRMPMLKTDETMHAAGGILTTANDLSRWLAAQIDDGVVDGKRIFPPNVVEETHRSEVSLDKTFNGIHRTGYGLGWYIGDYDGETLIHDFGGYEGWRAHVSFMPKHRIGVAVLTNTSGVGFFIPDLIAGYIYERILGKPDVDATFAHRIAQMKAKIEKREKAIAADYARRAARPKTLPRPLESYAGEYSNSVMGTVDVRVEGSSVVASIGQLSSKLTTFSGDKLRAELIPGEGTVLAFRFAKKGPATAVVWNGLVFERQTE